MRLLIVMMALVAQSVPLFAVSRKTLDRHQAAIASVSIDDCDDLLQTPVTAMQWVQLEGLIAEFEPSKRNLGGSESFRKLTELLGELSPADPTIRAEATRAVYGRFNLKTPLVHSLVFEAPAAVFAEQLLLELAHEGLLQKRDRSGQSLLIDWINAGQHMQAFGEKPRIKVSAKEREELEALLASEAAESEGLLLAAPEIARLIYLLADLAPADDDIRLHALADTLGLELAIEVTGSGKLSAERFASRLVMHLGLEGRLGHSTWPGLHPLIQIFAPPTGR